MKVLLIDDDPIQLATREAILRRAGVEVNVATTVESAFALLRGQREQIGLVVTDHIMPQTSGAQFVRQLRQESPEMPVLVVTGMPEAETEYEGMDVLFRHKPLNPEELISLVREVLSRNP